jgi:hypothetical protein
VKIVILSLDDLLIEFGDQLLIDPEDHEATILGPFGMVTLITLTSDNDDSEMPLT